MNSPNPDSLSQVQPSQYDSLSDDELLKLINASARLKGRAGNIPPQRRPDAPGYVDYDAKFGAPQ